MDNKPFISVSIKTLNESKGIEKTIDSIRRQLVGYPHKIIVGVPDKSVPQYNYKCHINAAQAVKSGLAVGVVEVVIIYDNSCVVHYVSLMEDGAIVDFTLGIDIVIVFGIV